MDKNYKLKKEEIKLLACGYGACMATDRILVDGCPVGYMYRKYQNREYYDSGWVFMSGDESQEYADDPDNWAIYDVNTICNYDPAIIPFLDSPYKSSFGRNSVTGDFEKEEDLADEK